MPTSAADTEITYTGNGVTVAYPFPFEVAKAAHFEATIDGVVVTDYTLSGLGVDTGGTCTFTTAPASLAVVVLARIAPYARTDFDYQEGGELAASTLDEDIDRAVMLSQQLATMSKRVPQVKRGDLTRSLVLTPEDGTVLGWASGALANLTLSSLSPSTVLVSDAGAALVGATATKDERNLMGVAFSGPSNIMLAATVNAGAITIALKGDDGTDHSVSNPGMFSVPNSLTDRTMTVMEITSATAITIPSGATLGALANKPFRVWLLGVKVGSGALALGVINPVFLSSGFPHDAQVQLFQLGPMGVAEPTANISGASDFATEIYLSNGYTATNRGYAVLGFLEFTLGLAAPGTWVAPTYTVPYRMGMPTPGDVVHAFAIRSAVESHGTTVLPIDDTIPQSGEGIALMTANNGLATLDMSSECNLLRIEATAHLASTNTDTQIAAALFLNSDTDACAASIAARVGTAGQRACVTVSYLGQNIDAAGAQVGTVNMRGGTASAGTTTFNGSASARNFGGRMASQIICQEIMT